MIRDHFHTFDCIAAYQLHLYLAFLYKIGAWLSGANITLKKPRCGQGYGHPQEKRMTE
jgi:hypothetical protein